MFIFLLVSYEMSDVYLWLIHNDVLLLTYESDILTDNFIAN